MEIGLGIAQIGHFAGPDHVVAMAVGAEERGYASLWALDRLLAPVAPRSAYPGNPEGLLPAAMAVALDPLVTLATVAASTTTIRLGTNVLVAPWYRPALLARSLASLDVMSRGRLDVGLGLGWSADEYDAVGVPQRELASRQDDLLDALEALWRPGVEAVSYEGRDFRVAPRASGRGRSSSPGHRSCSPRTRPPDSSGRAVVRMAGPPPGSTSRRRRPCGAWSWRPPRPRDATQTSSRWWCAPTCTTRWCRSEQIVPRTTARSTRSRRTCAGRSRSALGK